MGRQGVCSENGAPSQSEGGLQLRARRVGLASAWEWDPPGKRVREGVEGKPGFEFLG